MNLESHVHDVAVIGGGIAGLTAGIYCRRAGLNVLILEKSNPGGSIVNAHLVENFPGFPDGIPGAELGSIIMSQAIKWEVKFKFAELLSIILQNNEKQINTDQGTLLAKTIIIASGCRRKKLGIPGEAELIGKSIFFCGFCDGNQFTDQEIAVIGGGEGGVTEAIYLANIVSKVTIVEISDKLTASEVLVKRAKKDSKINIICSTAVEQITCEGGLLNLNLKNIRTSEKSNLNTKGVFVIVGLEPQIEFLKGIIQLDDEGFIVVSDRMETNISGIFAAGDVRSHSSWQAITAAGDGATAALSVQKFLHNN